MTTNASHGDSGWDCQRTMLCQPNRLGKITVWPRLETGNSSVAPWRIPSTIAWKVVIRLGSWWIAATAGITVKRLRGGSGTSGGDSAGRRHRQDELLGVRDVLV